MPCRLLITEVQPVWILTSLVATFTTVTVNVFSIFISPLSLLMCLNGVIKSPLSLREWVKESYSSVFFVLRGSHPILSTHYLRLSTFVGHGYWEVRPSVVFARRDFSLSYSLFKVRSQLPKVVSSGHCQASPFSGYPVRGCRFAVRANVRLRSVFTVGCESLYTLTALPFVLSLISSTVYSIAHFLTLCKGFLWIS